MIRWLKSAAAVVAISTIHRLTRLQHIFPPQAHCVCFLRVLRCRLKLLIRLRYYIMSDVLYVPLYADTNVWSRSRFIRHLRKKMHVNESKWNIQLMTSDSSVRQAAKNHGNHSTLDTSAHSNNSFQPQLTLSCTHSGCYCWRFCFPQFSLLIDKKPSTWSLYRIDADYYEIFGAPLKYQKQVHRNIRLSQRSECDSNEVIILEICCRHSL